MTLRGSRVKSRRILEMEGGAGRADKMNLFEVAGLSWERGEGDDGKNVPAEGGRVTRGDI